jgi:hypothetical protein
MVPFKEASGVPIAIEAVRTGRFARVVSDFIELYARGGAVSRERRWCAPGHGVAGRPDTLARLTRAQAAHAAAATALGSPRPH